MILTELAECSLADMIKDGKLKNDPRLTCQLMLDVVAGVSWLHSKVDERQHEVALHLDLKPSNILAVEQEEHRGGLVGKLADLGSCRLSAETTRMTQTSTGQGTAAYMAPEQWDQSIGKLSSTTDVYSLCVVLWEIVTGQQPFAGLSRHEIMRLLVGPGQGRPLDAAAMQTSSTWCEDLVSTVAAGLSIDPTARCKLVDVKNALMRQLQMAAYPKKFHSKRGSLPLPVDMICVVCVEPMLVAFNLSPCNHKVCEECGNRLVGMEGRCPHCREPFTQAAKDHTLSSIVQSAAAQTHGTVCEGAESASNQGGEVITIVEPAGTLTIPADATDADFRRLLMEKVNRGIIVTEVNAQRGKITDESMKLVAANCQQLQSLNVGGTVGRITDESMKRVAANCRQLQHLDVSWTAGMITDESMKLVAANCPQLQSLGVNYTLGRITDESMKLVAANCRQLQSLYVWLTNGKITDVCFSLLVSTCDLQR